MASHDGQQPPSEKCYRLKGKRVWVAGHRGMVGSAIARRLASEDCTILTAERKDLDFTRQADVESWMAKTRPQAMFIAAAKVGGILANSTYPAEFIYSNLVIQNNLIHAAHKMGVEKLLFLGSSCIYPKFASRHIAEEELLTGPLEPTNEWYAIAKIAGIKMCQAYRRQYGCDFISAMPTNLYGPGDNYDLKNGHVAAALLRKAHEAKQRGDEEMVIWGTGSPRREFLFVDDAADALVHLIQYYSGEGHINVGAGKDMTILELAEAINQIVGFKGKIVLDTTKPDGTPQKLLSIDKLTALGWQPKVGLTEGLKATYKYFLDNLPDLKGF